MTQLNMPSLLFQKLLDGNNRWSAGNLIHPDQTVERRDEVAPKQKPFATIIACMDSRVIPEIIFDQGIGDIVVIRTPGNVLTGVGIDGIKYAIEHLGTKLIVVLGHTKCGAVTAAVEANGKTEGFPDLLNILSTSVAQTKDLPGDKIENAVKKNVGIMTKKILTSLDHEILEGVEVVRAIYDINTGKVESLA